MWLQKRDQFAECDVTTKPGTKVEGPAIVELPEATLAVPPGWAGRVEPSGTIRLERTAR